MAHYKEIVIETVDDTKTRLSVVLEEDKNANKTVPYKITTSSGYAIRCSFEDLSDIFDLLEGVMEGEHTLFEEVDEAIDNGELKKYFQENFASKR